MNLLVVGCVVVRILDYDNDNDNDNDDALGSSATAWEARRYRNANAGDRWGDRSELAVIVAMGQEGVAACESKERVYA